MAIMFFLDIFFAFLVVYFGLSADGALGNERSLASQQLLGFRKDDKYTTACPDYRHYAAVPQ